MNKTHFAVLLSGFLLGNVLTMNAQSGNVSAGNDATGIGGTVNSSIGQIDYTTKNSSAGSIAEGIQQPYEIFIITGIEEKGITLSISVYPNPTNEIISLDIGAMDFEKMSYALFNLEGSLISQNTLFKKQTDIPLSGKAAGTYFMKVFNNKKEIKVFKIIKN